ncbi:MAG: hypothetical protein KDB54_05515 [Solirubrobacterales bacterium]|nr:hypothetical protein [Solirubrobacterales bacterium]MCB0860097.1 hypothetical protein [Solirubrobacterales bacterium]
MSERKRNRWIPVVLLLIVVGAVGAYLISEDSNEQKTNTQKTAKRKNKSRHGSGKSGAGDVNVNATYQEKYEVSAAVTGKYGLTDDDVSDVQVNGNSAEVTLSNGTVVPVTLEDGEWVPQAPQGDIPDAPQAQTPEVEQPSQPEQPQQPQVQTPQVSTPSALG